MMKQENTVSSSIIRVRRILDSNPDAEIQNGVPFT